MYSQEVESVLRQQGWSPERMVPIDSWVAQMLCDGFTVLPEAKSILRNFGGLIIKPVKRPDDAYAAGLLNFDPIFAASGEADRTTYWGRALRKKLTPLGELGYQALLYLAEDGRVYCDWGNILGECGKSFEDALESTLVIARRLPEKYMLDSEGKLVGVDPDWTKGLRPIQTG